uniref:Reverse transcriptase Ty1/copia-type domain-containing protein n=1 Tax=Tanacetum cinerariifolium TaxID=118510 RepID=A0A6L2JST7_TANCI|nr:hypothetical protein [Tanacetum cinerariifolium]
MAGDDNHDGDHPETSNTSQPVPPPTQQIPHIVSSIKLSILKRGEYDIWAMKMKHYLSYTDHPIWKVIQNVNGPVSITIDTNEMIKVLPPKTAVEVVARRRERKARTTLLMALPENHLAKLHKIADVKEMWEAIKSRFGGNNESKKMQKYLLKQQFECFSMSTSEGLHKGYDRFQTLMSQLKIHGAGISHEDADQKFLRSLPSSWSQVALIMRTKPGLDTLSFDDLYNNLRVFEHDVKCTTASSSNTQNVAFVSVENTSSTNDVSTAYSVSSPFVSKSQKEGSSSYTDEVVHSFFVNQLSAPQLNYDDLEQINDDDMEEIDLKWQVAMISMRIKKFHKRTGRKLQFDTKDPVDFDKTKVDNDRRPAYQDDLKALVTIDGEDINWSGHVKEDAQNYVMMAYFSSNSGSDNEVKSCSKTCEESYARLKKLYDEQRDKLGDACLEITAYTLALKKVEAQLLCHQQNQLAYEQKIRFMKIDLDDKTDVLAYHKKLLAEALKEKKDLKTKFENWQNSSKNLSRLLNTQLSANDKFGLRYGDYRYGSILSYENEVIQSVFMNKASDLEDTSVNDRYADGMHVVPPPITGNYMPFRLDSYSDKDSVSIVQEDKEQPSFAFTDSVKHVKTSRENVKETGIPHYSPKVEKQDRNGHTRKGLGYAFTRKACFVCGSFSHLIRDCDFHEKRMVKQAELTKSKNKDDPHKALKDKRIVDSGCSMRMTGNKAHLADYQEFKEANNSIGTQANDDQSANLEEIDLHEEHFVLPIWSAYSTTVKSSGDKIEKNTDFKTCEKPVSQVEQIFLEELDKLKRQEKEANDAVESLRKEATHNLQNANTSSTNLLNTVSTPLSTACPLRAFNNGEPSYPDDLLMPHLEDIYASLSEGIFTDSSYDEGVVTDFNNLETSMNVSPTLITRIHTIHPKTQIIGDPMSAIQTMRKVNKNSEAYALFQIQKVWILVDLPFGKKAIGTKWVYKNNKDERGVVVRNKARLVTQVHRQQEGIDYDEVFAHVARIKAIRIFLAFASYMGFIVYQMDVKSSFLYGTIDEEVYVSQPLGFVDPKFSNKVYKVVKALYGLHQAPRACVKTASTPIETQKPLVKDKETADVDLYLYRNHFIRDAYEKKLIQVLKIHTDDNVADLLTKDFDVSGFNFLFTMSNPHQELASPEANDFCKELASPKQTALGKDKSNPFMAGSFPKTKCAGFEQVVDFLNTQVIQYALMVNPTIYVSCIKQFWATASIKKANNVVKLQALIDGKNVVVTEDVIRQDLLLDDVDGVECLPNEEIFTELARMGYENVKRTAWNKFSCSMASAINCLATVMINNQVDDLSSHTTRYTSHVLTQKVFANMRRVEEEEEVEVPTALAQPSPTNAPSPPPKDHISTPPQARPATPPVSPPQEQPTDTSESSMSLLNTLMETCATLSQKVTELEQDKQTQALEILKLKKRVKKLEKKRKSKQSGLKRLKKRRIDDVSVATKDVNGVEPTVFDDEEVTMTMAQILIKIKAEKARLLDEQMAKRLHDKEEIPKSQEETSFHSSARKNMIIYLKNMAGYKMEHFRGMTYDKELSEEDVQNMLEIFLVSEFKVKALQVKYPFIDWEIHSEGSRSYWKIIKVGGIIKAYQSFEDMLKGFVREDLDALWRLEKEKFS